MGIGFMEMLIVAAIALVFLGPEKFPDFAKLFIRTIRDIRNYMDDVKEEVTKEVLPVKQELQQLTRYDAETYINKLMSEDDDKSTSATPQTFSSDKTGDTPQQPHDGGEYTPTQDTTNVVDTAETSKQPESQDPLQTPQRLDG